MSPHAGQRQSTHTPKHPRWVLEQGPQGGSAVLLSFWSADEAAHQQDVKAPR